MKTVKLALCAAVAAGVAGVSSMRAFAEIDSSDILAYYKFDGTTLEEQLKNEVGGNANPLAFVNNGMDCVAIFNGVAHVRKAADGKGLLATNQGLGNGYAKATIEMWIRSRTLTSGGFCLYGYSNKTTSITTFEWTDKPTWGMMLSSSGAVTFGVCKSGQNAHSQTVSNGALSDFDWHHLALVVDGTLSTTTARLAVYVDGVKASVSSVDKKIENINFGYLQLVGMDYQIADLRVTKTVVDPADFLAVPSIDEPELPESTAVWTGAAGDRFWSTAANWKGNAVPVPGQDVYLGENAFAIVDCDTAKAGALVAGGTIIFSGAKARLNADTIALGDASFVTCEGPFDNTLTNRVRFACTDFTLSSGAQISLTGRGFKKGAGPGVGTTATSGSSHGGLGSLVGNVPNDDLEYPVLPGSGGTSEGETCGGGVVEIAATGKVTLEGQIVADGTGGKNLNAAGAGGSILVTCAKLMGHGATLKAQGGTNYSQSNAGYNSPPGSGGRIALHYTDATDFAPALVSVLNGRWLEDSRSSTVGYGYAETVPNNCAAMPGTIWVSDATFMNGFGTKIRGGVANVSALTLNGDVTLTQYAQLLDPGAVLRVRGSLTLAGRDARLQIGWSTDFVSTTKYDAYRPDSSLAPKLVVGGNLVLANGACLDVYSANVSTNATDAGAFIDVVGDLRLEEGALMQLASHCTGGQSPLVTAENIFITSNATVSADGLGWGGSRGLGCNTTAYGNSRQGGSYGGKGGITTSKTVPEMTYGIAMRPCYPGSGSYRYAGAGCVRLVATRRMVLDGKITANGIADGENNGTGASSSGGAILIDCRTFSGCGSLTANGGSGNSSWGNHSGCGGGGRIAVYAGAPWKDEYLTGRARVRWFDAEGAAVTENKGLAGWTGTATASGGVSTAAAGTSGEDGTVVFGICRGAQGFVITGRLSVVEDAAQRSDRPVAFASKPD